MQFVTKNFIWVLFFIITKSYAIVDPVGSQMLSSKISPLSFINQERFQVTKENVEALRAHKLWPEIKKRLIENGIDLSYIESDIKCLNISNMREFISDLESNETFVVASELKGHLNNKINNLVEIIRRIEPGSVVLLDFNGVIDGKNNEDLRLIEQLKQALKDARGRNINIFIYSNGSSFAREESAKIVFDMINEGVLTTISILELFTHLGGKEFHAGRVELEEVLDEKGKQARYTRMYPSQEIVYFVNSNDLNKVVSADTQVNEKYFFNPRHETKYKPSVMIFPELGAISVSSSLEFRGRRESTLEDQLLFNLCPAAECLDGTLKNTLKSILVDKAIKGNMMASIVDLLIRSHSISDKKIPHLIFIDNDIWKIKGGKKAMEKLMERGLINQGISICYDPSEID